MDRPWYAFYNKDVPRTIVYPETTLKDLFNRNADTHPDKPHLVFNDAALSYRVCNTIARALANGLLERGVVKGDRVALMMPNIPQYPIALMACYKMGAIAVPVNPLFTIPELITQFKDSGAESVIVMAPFADKAYVVLKPGVAMTAEALTDFCKERLAPYKVPKSVEFIDQLPRTPVGKPDRKALRLMNEKGG